MLTSLPNLLTLSRIALIPVLLALFYVDAPWAPWAACAVFSTAAATDYFDGWVARQRRAVSVFGRLMDPIADKMLVAATLFALVAIAKGPDRNAGRERFFMAGRAPFGLEPRDPMLYFLQRLRDEAHRFAIGTHRARRGKEMARSPIDEIPGIGPRRKRALLLRFGSAKAVARASLADLETVEGINKTVAKKIYDHFHAGG